MQITPHTKTAPSSAGNTARGLTTEAGKELRMATALYHNLPCALTEGSR